MSLLGNVVGHAAATVGRAYDYATPGSGTSALTNAGRAVYDPNVVLSNPSGIFTKSPAFTPALQPNSQPSSGGSNPQQSSNPDKVLGDSTTVASNAYGGYATPADYQAAQDALMQINQGLTGANDSLGRLDSQKQVGLGNIDKSYQDAYNKLLGTQQLATRDYTTNRNGQLNDYLAAKDQNGTVARNWLDNARRTLGSQGAGGGSAARYGIVNDANGMLQGSNAATTNTNNKNIIALDTANGDNQNKFKNAFGDLASQRQTNKNDLTSKIESQRQSLLNTIAQLTGQKTIANGGDYKAALAAANPYLSQIPSIQDKIDALAATPAITPQAVQLTAPTLQQYNWAQPQAPIQPQQDPTLQDNNVVPVVNPDDQKNRNGLLGMFGIDPNQLQYVQ